MSIADELRKLQELHDSGALTDEEFAQAKAAVLCRAIPVHDPVAEDTNRHSIDSCEVSVTARDDAPLALWYLLPKGGRKEGPLTLDQLRQVVPAPGLRIRLAADSDWCSWTDAAQRYPELVAAGVLPPVPAPHLSPSLPAHIPAPGPS
jgi:hypothetical protein